MIEDMSVRHFASKTQHDYIRTVMKLTRFLGRSHDAARLRPASGLIGEACVGSAHVIGRATNRAFEQIADTLLQDAVRRQANGVFDPFCLQIVAASVAFLVSSLIAASLASSIMANPRHGTPSNGSLAGRGMEGTLGGGAAPGDRPFASWLAQG
jgi:hypothetical protein